MSKVPKVLQMQTFSRLAGPYAKGVSMIEMLIVLGVIAVMLALAAPAIQTVAARADIRATADQVFQAIRVAKNTARVSSQPVTVTFSTTNSTNTISFTFANGTNIATNGVKLNTIDLPEKVSVTTELGSITFDSMGLIVGFSAGTIVLTSTVDSSQVLTVTVINNLGYITIAGDVTIANVVNTRVV